MNKIELQFELQQAEDNLAFADDELADLKAEIRDLYADVYRLQKLLDDMEEAQ